MKKLFALTIAAALLLTMTAFAGAEILRVEYEGNGSVEVQLNEKVNTDGLAVTVTDPEGNPVPASVREEKDDREDDIDFLIENYAYDTEYAFELTGGFGSLTGTVRIPAESELIRKVDPDYGDREIEIEFFGKVEYENPTVTITTDAGTACEARITEQENDSLEVAVSDLTRGNTYTVTVSGVRAAGTEAFGIAEIQFTAN